MSIRAPSMQKYFFVSFPSFVICTSRYHTRLQQRDFEVKKNMLILGGKHNLKVKLAAIAY